MIATRQYTSGSEILAARAALRKRLFSPRTAPRKSEEPIEPVQTRIYLTAPVERVWSRQHDSHMAAYYEWKGNEPLGYLKLRCRELELVFDEITSNGCRKRIIVKPRQALMCEVKTKYPHLSLPAVGRLFGGFDHTTVLHALRSGGIDLEELMKAKRTADTEAATIHRLLLAGKTQREIADDIGFSQKAVSVIVRRYGWERDNPGQRISTYHDEVREMFDSGATYAEIGRALCFAPKNVSSFIKRKGWTR